MPRDISGNYTPPVGTKPTPNTIISTTTENTFLDDLSAVISQTVSTTGVPPMQAPLKFADGSVTAPGITWNAAADTGIYRPTGAPFAITTSGIEAVRITTDRNLLVGTTGNTGEKLNVNGTAKINGKLQVVTGGAEVTAGNLVIAAGDINVTGNASVSGNVTVGGNLAITGTTTGVTKAMVGLDRVNNTNDAEKPVSTATQAAIDALIAARRGTVSALAYNGSIPTGAFLCNGQAVSRATYSALFALVGTTYGAGDGSTTFNVPNYQGTFLRGLDNGRGLDTGRTFGSYQDHLFASHNHGVNDPSHAHGVYDPGHAHSAWTDGQGNHAHTYSRAHLSGIGAGSGGFIGIIPDGYENLGTSVDGNHGHNVGIGGSGTGISIYGSGTGISIQANGGAETRPRNYSVNYIIWY